MRQTDGLPRNFLVSSIVTICLSLGAAPSHAQPGKDSPETPREPPLLPLPEAKPRPPQHFVERLPSAAARIEFVRVPVGELEGQAIEPFWMSTTEITWDAYDVFAFALDMEGQEEEGEDVDAFSRPSRPYVPPDRGFGHAGYPAIGMTRHAAEQFCRWLSARTGRSYRLPTEIEWRWACARGRTEDEPIERRAWSATNAGDKTHPAGELAPNALGIHDMHGNVAEWVAGPEIPTALGGSYVQDADEIGCEARLVQDETWNMSDPQIPKSRWWLADSSWVGFRVVCESDTKPSANPENDHEDERDP